MKQIKISILCIFTSLLAMVALQAQSSNVQTVMNNYAAFSKGDIPAIISTLAPDCSWYHVGNPSIVPFAGTFKGPEAIAAKFFTVIPTVLEVTAFEPAIVEEKGNVVVASVRIEGKSIATGKTFGATSEMRWTFDNAGKVVKYENTFDPAGLEAALTK